ncbi:hypothetical protein [Pseudonocardia xishanensis]|uniref:hypothetical protein n=1 Tax=Pseudonocardia xishanensis TaxID=630995 RepID=UPI0031E56BDF
MVGRRGDAGHRVCVAVDLEGYGRRTDAGQERAQEGLATLLDTVWAATVPAGAVARQPNGDGEVALLGAEVGAEVVGAVFAALEEGLRAANRTAPEGERLRLRVAAGLGRARPARNGFAGGGVVRTCRVLASRVLHDALRDRPGADLAAAVSEPVFAAAARALPADEYRRVLVSEPAKAFRGWVWLHVGAPLPAPRGRADPVPDRAPAVGSGMRIEITDGGLVGTVVQAGELHGGLTLRREDRR